MDADLDLDEGKFAFEDSDNDEDVDAADFTFDNDDDDDDADFEATNFAVDDDDDKVQDEVKGRGSSSGAATFLAEACVSAELEAFAGVTASKVRALARVVADTEAKL